MSVNDLARLRDEELAPYHLEVQRRLEELGTIERADGLDAPQRSELDELRDEDRELIRRREAKIREAAQNPGQVERETPRRNSRLASGDPWADPLPAPGAPESATQLRSRALTAVERAIGGMPDAAKEASTRALEVDPDPDSGLARYVIETSRPEYLRAFSKWLADPVSGGHSWTPDERAAVQSVKDFTRSMTLGTTTAGGFLVPYQLDPAILISSAGSVDPMREVARVEQTVYNEARFVTSAGVSASWDAEEAEVSDDAPTLAQPAIICRKGAAFVPVSIELFEDSTIAQQVGTLFADAKAQLEAAAFTTGNGTTEPKGIITALVAAGGTTVIATGTNVLAQADLYANQAALPPRWRGNAKWMMNLSILNGYRQLPQATGLNYSVINDATTPPTALGWQVRENSSMDGTLGAGADYTVLSGDFRQYIIADRVGASVEYIPHLFGANRRPTGQRGFYLHWRTGGDVVIPDAFRLTNHST